jgi:hypothetical protein
MNTIYFFYVLFSNTYQHQLHRKMYAMYVNDKDVKQ